MRDCRHASHSRSSFLAAAGAATTMLLPETRALAQNRPAGARLIDIHHHHYPPELVAQMNASQAKRGLPPVNPAFWTPEKSLAQMDASGITTSVLSLSSPYHIWFDADPKAIPALARACNEFAVKMIRDHPSRYGFFAALPMPDVDASLKEVAYAFDTLHADGIGLPTSFGDRWPGDAAFNPLWAELNRRKAIVVFHPYAPNCCTNGMEPGVSESLLEYPYDTARTFMSLLTGGTLVTYPDVRFTLCHGGGALPYLTGRLVTLGLNDATMKKLGISPADIEAAVKRMYYDTANATFPATMAALLREIPLSQIMFGTDYPYVTGAQNLGPLDSQGLSPSVLTAIKSGNAIRQIPRLAAL
jgi:6-methylsalicylate decarboxylase